MNLSLFALELKAAFIIDTSGGIHLAKKISIALTELVNLSSFNNRWREADTSTVRLTSC